ncbi:MAG: hypothetical protein GX591_17530 [Planctomycetes bacterium]|nr:hypothetical protein [Planctomycetota bacterium]
MNRAPSTAATVLAVVVLTTGASGYVHFQIGVFSNLLIADGTVLFTQADGSLARLDLQSGAVTWRGTEELYLTQLRRTPHGILGISRGCGTVRMFDPDSLAVIWQAAARYQVHLAGDRLVCCDNEGTIEYRRLNDGAILWSRPLGSVPVVHVVGNTIIVGRFGPGNDLEYGHLEDCLEFLLLLDLDTGHERLRMDVPEDVKVETLFHDDAHLYLCVKAPQPVSADTIEVLDLAGNPIERLNVPRKPGDNYPAWGSWFTVGDRIFDPWTGRVASADRAEMPFPRVLNPGLGPHRPPLPDDTKIEMIASETTGGVVGVTVTTPAGTWQGVLPYVLPDEGIQQWTYADGRLLLASSLGHVECVDAATGRSLWMYLFPTMCIRESFSLRGMPSCYPDIAARYRREILRSDPPGLYVLPDGQTVEQFDLAAVPAAAFQRPPVIRDPATQHLFPDLDKLVRRVWAVVLLPAVLWAAFAIVHRKARRPLLGAAAVADLTTAAAVTSMVFRFGRISSPCSLTGKILIVLLAGAAVYHAVRLWRRRRLPWRIAAVLVVGAVAVLGYWAMPVLRWA